MLGGAKPAELLIKIESDASDEMVGKLVRLAEASSPAHAVMREVLDNTFSLKLNGHNLPVTDVTPSSNEAGPDPEEGFTLPKPRAHHHRRSAGKQGGQFTGGFDAVAH